MTHTEKLRDAVTRLTADGWIDFMVDRCGLWQRQSEELKESLLDANVAWIDEHYDDGEHQICYIQLEWTRYPEKRKHNGGRAKYSI